MRKRVFNVDSQELLNYVRLKFWPIWIGHLTKKTMHSCVACFKVKPIPCPQLTD